MRTHPSARFRVRSTSNSSCCSFSTTAMSFDIIRSSPTGSHYRSMVVSRALWAVPTLIELFASRVIWAVLHRCTRAEDIFQHGKYLRRARRSRQTIRVPDVSFHWSHPYNKPQVFTSFQEENWPSLHFVRQCQSSLPIAVQYQVRQSPIDLGEETACHADGVEERNRGVAHSASDVGH